MNGTATTPRPTPRPVDSDPRADELLHRVRHPRSNLTACAECLRPAHSGPCPERVAAEARYRVEVETAYILRDRQAIDAYRAWAQGVAA